MTFNDYLICVIMSILGQAAHLFLLKIPAIKQRSRAANKTFYFKEWWAADWNVIIGTQVLIAMLVLGLKEFLYWKPGVAEYVRWFFGLFGAFGSVVAMAKGSSFEKNLVGLLDVKSNIADAVTGGTHTIEETIEKGTEVTGQQVKPTNQNKNGN